MKKLFFAAALVGLTLASCNDDDDTVVNAAVEGNWKLTGFTLDEPVDFNNDGTLSTNLITETGCYNASGLVFSGTGQAVVSLQSIEATITGDNSNPTINIECLPADVAIGTYTITQNTVTLSGGAGDGDMDVVLTRSGNTLSVYFPEMQDVPVEGEAEVSVVGATLTFTKQ